ncbi:molybdopterin-guanine dinucleotide biosynthesis protein B [Pokkaliibacter sp. CJK22405]|uniref:molybdopterin-guanine dinucleotide biosynthesis protein B n=1 Tax=Pokkaliibacter sp. CJK22405 TaxID=3384615 RepID=UPI003984977E
MSQPFTLVFAAFSGTGKTTLLEQVVGHLAQANYRVGVIKHSHHDLELDKPGKDSYRLRKAGAVQGILVTPQRSVVFHEQPFADNDLRSQLALLNTAQLDMVLVEGYRYSDWPKIELHRTELGHPFLFVSDPAVIALAWNCQSDEITLPQLDINDAASIARFVEKQYADYQKAQSQP